MKLVKIFELLCGVCYNIGQGNLFARRWPVNFSMEIYFQGNKGRRINET